MAQIYFFSAVENRICIQYLTADETKLYLFSNIYWKQRVMVAGVWWVDGKKKKKINILRILRICRQEVFGLLL